MVQKRAEQKIEESHFNARNRVEEKTLSGAPSRREAQLKGKG